VASLKIPDVIERLALKPGDHLADIGAGTGVFEVPFSRAVGPSGLVYAVEIDQGLLDIIARKAREAKTDNIRGVLGEFGDPKLPAADVDLAFFHDVLHHIEDRAGYLKALARYVKPAGRIAVIEDDTARSAKHQRQAEMRMTKEQIAELFYQAGFKPVQEFTDLYPDKWFVVYARK
jgi:arsenite methyltransferase